MNPTIMALALLQSPWVEPAERDAFVRDLLYSRSVVTVTINWRIHAPVQPGYKSKIDSDGNVWRKPLNREVGEVVAWIYVGNIRDSNRELDAKFEAEADAHDDRDMNGDGWVDGDDIQGFVSRQHDD